MRSYRLPFGRAVIGGLGLAAVAVLVASCGTVSKAECQAGDWRSIGEADGRNGEPMSRFDQHAESCARYGLPADREPWLDGRERGLVSYCTPLSGYANGSAGRTYHNVCSGPAGGAFVEGYGLGQVVASARKAADRARDRARDLENTLNGIDRDIDETRAAAQVAEGADRDNLRRRLRDLEDRRFDVRSDLSDAERESREARREADLIEADARVDFASRFGVLPQ